MAYPVEFERLPFLSPPFEIFEFRPCETVYFHVVDYELGRIRIVPRYPGAPPEKIVPAIRLHMHEEFKPVLPRYWDLTPSRLVFSLLPLLQADEHLRNYLVIHRTVAGPRAHFSIQLIPFEAVTREEALKKLPRLGF